MGDSTRDASNTWDASGAKGNRRARDADDADTDTRSDPVTDTRSDATRTAYLRAQASRNTAGAADRGAGTRVDAIGPADRCACPGINAVRPADRCANARVDPTRTTDRSTYSGVNSTTTAHRCAGTNADSGGVCWHAQGCDYYTARQGFGGSLEDTSHETLLLVA
ncbi:mlr9521 (plasmid) [Mesorhizobium japonicum MAFF 303099]|uniref:Mlr9521 protein n=1 Tax=Mesorhizobium japonicum (strain LMG 29417 / CECT 9101 / MAFF 303099) TaxID=266835 RepID=Q98PC3_RHILO|nr:mlr9521 [Mesorhizobium japonicum MAFF 303099]